MSRWVSRNRRRSAWRALRAECGIRVFVSALLLLAIFGSGTAVRFHPGLARSAARSNPDVPAPSPPDIRLFRTLLDRRPQETCQAGAAANWVESLRSQETRGPESAVSTMPGIRRSHPLGTDPSGRDLLLGTLTASTLYLGPGLLVAVLSLGIGLLLGGFSSLGHHPRRRAVLRILDDILASLPRFVIVMFFLSFFRVDIWILAVPIGVMTAARVSRAVSAKLLFLGRMDFIDSARELGVPEGRILWKHLLLANCRGLLVGQAVLAFADFILIESTMGYLGLGIEGQIRSWGTLISEGTRTAYLSTGILWVAAFPSLLLVAALCSLHCIAGLAERLMDPVVRL